jgi:hypothetical protein
MVSSKFLAALAVVATLVAAAVTFASPGRAARTPPVMLILRGIASLEHPRGQLDDQSALEYAQRLGFRGEVLDVAADAGAGSPQITMALERIRGDEAVTGIYGFSGGGYNARVIWRQMSAAERERIRKVVVIGSPELTKADFPGSSEVLIQSDPPEGHLAGPKALLDSL